MGHWRASKGMGMCDTWIGGLEKLTGDSLRESLSVKRSFICFCSPYSIIHFCHFIQQTFTGSCGRHSWLIKLFYS